MHNAASSILRTRTGLNDLNGGSPSKCRQAGKPTSRQAGNNILGERPMYKKITASFFKVLISLSLVIVLAEGISFAANAGGPDNKGLQHYVDSGKLPAGIQKKIEETGKAEILLMVDDRDVKKSSKEMRTARGLKADDRDIINWKSRMYRQKKDRVFSKASPADYKLLHDYEHFPIMHINVNEKSLVGFMKDAEVSMINENGTVLPHLTESLLLIDASPAHTAGATGAGTSVAVLDTGVNYTLAAFGSCTAPGDPIGTCRVVFAQDFSDEDNDGLPDNDGFLDEFDHGTNVSGIVAGVAPEATLLNLDVFRLNGYAYYSDLLSALNWVLANKAAYNIVAVNMSLGGGMYSEECSNNPLTPAISDLRDAGVATAVSSGNDGYTYNISAPACAPGAISVGAVYDANIGPVSVSGVCSDASTAADQVACFSNSASFLRLLAPGAMITAAGINMGGTSQAAPHVSGAVACIKSLESALSVTEVQARMEATGVSIEDAKNDVITPRLDLNASVSVTQPILVIEQSGFSFMAAEGGLDPAGDIMDVINAGTGVLTWSASNGGTSWLSLTPSSGAGTTEVAVDINTVSLAPGIHNATITVTAPGALNSPATRPVELEIVNSAFVEDFETGDLTKFPWVTGGNGNWIVQNSTFYAGGFAAQSPAITHSQSSYLQVTLNVTTPGYVYFWVKTSTELEWDKVKFYIDGVNEGPFYGWSGNTDWTFARSEHTVSPGVKIFKWIYSKDSTVSEGSDRVWLDDIFFPPSNLVSVSPLTKDFGDVAVNSASALQTFTVSNIGGTNTTLGTLSLSGTDQTEFVIENDLCSSQILGASGSCTVGVKFMPASQGPKSASLNIPSDYVATTVASLSGTALIPDAAVNPTSHNFGSVNVGASFSAQTFTVSNNGTGDLIIGTISLSGTDASDFAMQNDLCSGQTIAPTGSCTVEAKFSPLSAGSKSASLSIPSNDPDTPTLNASLSGTGIVTLTVNKDGSTGFGTVTSSPLGISCGSDCSETYTESALVTLTAVADSNSTFSGWSGGCTGTGTCEVTMSVNRTVTAVFTILPPVADFIGSILSGTAPLAVNFSDLSTNNPTGWAWDFGVSGTNSKQNPLHTFRSAGTYTVTLTASNTSGSDSEVKTDYIIVNPCANQPVRISGVDKGTSIQTVYNNNAVEADVIKTQAVEFIENLSLGRPIPITLSGGHNCDYSDNPSDTAIHGSLTISDGTVTVENIVIQ